ncbi:MAG: hypothetical protein OEN21_19385 [Myxococcales bacterium]|nr:hypothetical protein [Myxococcales bacterium]
MTRFSFLSIALLVCAVACGDSSGEGEVQGGEIQSQQDVSNFFQAVAPELIALFNQLAAQQSAGVTAFSTKQSSSVSCPGGGSLDVDTSTGQATLTDCSARGIIINADLALLVEPIGVSSYQANFNGILMVSGTFTGTIQVMRALIQWTDPATEDNTYWEVMVLLNSQPVTVTSADSGGGETVTPRVGGSCVPGQQGDFSCTSTCLDICLPEEVSQTAFCAEDSVCECRCVNYNL